MNERDLFLSALEIEDAAQRQAHLEAACCGNPELLSRVELLLASHEGSSQFLNVPAMEQLHEKKVAGGDATVVMGTGSTHGENSAAVDTAGLYRLIAEHVENDDEALLSYLQPSARADSLGRLAHYEILEIIGRGAFGTVLRAFDDKLQRVVAIKVLAPALAATSPARKRFLREAQLSAQIRHEHVVNVYAVEEKPIPYLVMEYIPGQTLQQRLEERGPLDVPSVLKLGRQIAEGLAAAHAMDMIHRDIKPGNILLEARTNECVKITDFGLARAADDASMTQSGMIAGTPMYMAPEQALGQRLDQRADLFSFGSVLYQMVSGRAPFRAPSTLAVLKRVTEDTPRPIQEVIPETPSWLCNIIAKLHEKNPEDRYQTAQEVADVLANCEAQLQAHNGLQDYSLIPRLPQTPITLQRPHIGSWWKAVAAVVIAVPLLALLGDVLTRGPRIKEDERGPATQPVGAVQKGWVQLFNGRDLTGWKTHEELPRGWEVKEGVLTSTTGTSYLFSDRGDYTDFHLRVEAKTDVRGDGGIYFRAPFAFRQGTQAWMKQPATGYEAELYNDQAPRGTLWQIVPGMRSVLVGRAKDPPAIPAGEWFTLEIIARKNRFITRINGQETVNCWDPQGNYTTGHLALSVFGNGTAMQFRRIEIKELSASDIESPGEEERPVGSYASNENIEVIPLIDPPLDKWNNTFTGRNEWRIEKGDLVVGYADAKPSKLIFPLDSDWAAFECQLDFTRRVGAGGFNVNIPARTGECPAVFNSSNQTGIYLGGRNIGVPINDEVRIDTGKRNIIRLEVRKQGVSVWFNDVAAGTWQGDLGRIAKGSEEGYQHARRMSLWIPGGSEFVFHQIRIRMLDGSTAHSLRPAVETTPYFDSIPPLAIAPFDAEQAKAHQLAWAKHLGVPVEYENSLKMKFRLIPPGEFTMGSTPAEIESALNEQGEDKLWQAAVKSEGPLRKVKLTRPIYCSVYEVTQSDYQRVMGENPADFAPLGTRKEHVAGMDTAHHPIESVSWLDAAEFCAKLSANEKHQPYYARTNDKIAMLDGAGYRLPTEAEWEFACRAGTTTKFWNGDSAEDLMQAGWSSANSAARTHAVGELQANPFGLFDTQGNVGEWTQDAWDTTAFDKDSEKTAIDRATAFSAGSKRVFRGGRWHDDASRCRSAARFGLDASSHHDDIGFRVMLAVEAVKAATQVSQSPTLANAPFNAAQAKAHQLAWAKHLGVPVEYENSLKMKFQLIPPGTFTMGSSPEEIDRCLKLNEKNRQGKDEEWHRHRITSEGPAHEVEITKPFYLAATHVTVGQYRKFTEKNDGLIRDGRWDRPGWEQTDEHPVVFTAWADAQAFCQWLGDEEKLVYRLPTEAEWELACRAGTTTSFPFGNSEDDLARHGWFNSNSEGHTHPVAKLAANPFGLYDMQGNAWQWCQDPHHPDFYKTSPKQDPVGKGDGNILRGGSWENFAVECRSAFRNSATLAPTSQRGTGSGFRVALMVESVQKALDNARPFTDADANRIAALPALQQVDEIRKELVRLNPGFDGTLTPTIDNEVVTELSFNSDAVDNIAPVRALKGLLYLDCRGTYPNKGKLSDLSPLKGLTTIVHIDCSSTQIADLSPLAGLPLTNLQFNHNPVSDLTPLKNMPLLTLGCAETKVADFSPLKGLKLKILGAQLLAVTDLSPLEGMPLTGIDLYHTIGVTSLEPLKGMPLEGLNLQDVPISDLTPLKDMTSLRMLLLQGCKVTDLSPLAGLKLTDLFLLDEQITDISPLKGMPLKRLEIHGSGITDLRPLQGMELDEIRLTPKSITQGLEILREMKSLKLIGIESGNAWPSAEFWQRYDKGEFAVAPFTDAEAARIAALPAKEQFVAVVMELKKRNPEFKGLIEHQIDNDKVTQLSFDGPGVKDVLPIKALVHLRDLSFVRCQPDVSPLRDLGLTAISFYNSEVADLSMLKGMKLTSMDLSGSRNVVDLSPLKELPLEGLTIYATQVSDLKPLAGMKLKYLNCSASAVTDLSPLKGMPLEALNLDACHVADLAPLAGSSLTVLYLRGTLVTDLSPLKDVPLKTITLDFQAARDAKHLRAIKTLETINDKPAEEFLKEAN